MNKLLISAIGKSKQEISQKRGKLFEKLCVILLRFLGYETAGTPNVNYSGIEIDIDAKSIATSTPLYAECKCYTEDIDAPHVVKFFGKYMTMYRRDNRSQGLLLVLPHINSHAQGFYKEHCENQTDISIILYEEEKIINFLIQNGLINNYRNYQSLIKTEWGIPGDYYYLYCAEGFFFIQLIIPKGSALPSSVAVFTSNSELLTDEASINLVRELDPTLDNYNLINKNIQLNQIERGITLDQIVEVRGSSECFEYQFPAAPEFFIGRTEEVVELKNFVNDVLINKASSRGILLEANSGWGKSSLVLNIVDVLKKMQHYTIAIDSRSASSSQFLLQSFYHVFKKYQRELEISSEKGLIISGFNGLLVILKKIDVDLKKDNKLLIIFLDQFENLFIDKDRLKPISDLLLYLCDRKLNIILGFSWKSDLVGMMNEFPYSLRDNII